MKNKQKSLSLLLTLSLFFIVGFFTSETLALERKEIPANQNGTCKICTLGPQKMAFQCTGCGKEISVIDAQLVTTITDYYTQNYQQQKINLMNVSADVLNAQYDALLLPEGAIAGPHWHKYRCPSCGAVTSSFIGDLKAVEDQKRAEEEARKKETAYLEEQQAALQKQQELARQQQELAQSQEADRQKDRSNQQLQTAANLLLSGASMAGPGATCFIATAVYGSPDAADVIILREFRDEYLLNSFSGRLAVFAYYEISPPIARYIAKDEKKKAIVRKMLAPIVKIARMLVKK
jgi:hypothetical protein